MGVLEGVGAYEHDVQQHARGPHVDGGAAVGLVSEHLGCKVCRRAHDGLALALLHLRPLGVAEVADFDERAGARAADEGVLELDITVRNTRAVQVLEAAHELLEEVARIVLRETLGLANEAEELAAFTRGGVCVKVNAVSSTGVRIVVRDTSIHAQLL